MIGGSFATILRLSFDFAATPSWKCELAIWIPTTDDWKFPSKVGKFTVQQSTRAFIYTFHEESYNLNLWKYTVLRLWNDKLQIGRFDHFGSSKCE